VPVHSGSAKITEIDEKIPKKMFYFFGNSASQASPLGRTEEKLRTAVSCDPELRLHWDFAGSIPSTCVCLRSSGGFFKIA
jgi:hypothetical protein